MARRVALTARAGERAMSWARYHDRRKRTGFLSWRVAGHIVRNSAGLVTAILIVYFGSLALGYGVDGARTAAFATWLLGHIVLAMNLMSGIQWLSVVAGSVAASGWIEIVKIARDATPGR